VETVRDTEEANLGEGLIMRLQREEGKEYNRESRVGGEQK
jgi:hypothetical protein